MSPRGVGYQLNALLGEVGIRKRNRKEWERNRKD
jgi:hypothetical protein